MYVFCFDVFPDWMLSKLGFLRIREVFLYVLGVFFVIVECVSLDFQREAETRSSGTGSTGMTVITLHAVHFNIASLIASFISLALQKDSSSSL